MGVDYLGSFLKGFLWVDEDWLVREGDAATYWQGRLAQRIRVCELGDARLKWQVDTTVVVEVANEGMALELCMELNEWTAGWSFAYSEVGRSIHALCSIVAPAEWDRFAVRLSEAAKLSAWMSDAIAEALAGQVGGRPAFGHPDHQPSVRKDPDAVASLMTVLRERPEWVFDPTPGMYPGKATLGAYFASMMGSAADGVEVDAEGITITTMAEDGESVSSEVVCCFERSWLYGMCWLSELQLPGHSAQAAPEHVNHLAWQMYEDPHASLLGGWVFREDTLVFSQVTLSGELRSMEKLASFSRRGEQLLWGIVSTLNHAALAASRSAADLQEVATRRRIGDDARTDAVSGVLAALSEGAREALEQVPTVRGDRADRRLLWLIPRCRLLTCAWFNPMGPTLTTLELCSIPGGQGQYLVQFMRHPFSPRYLVYARCDSIEVFRDALPTALEDVFTGSLPGMLVFDQCPPDVLEPVMAATQRRLLALARESGTDFLQRAGRIAASLADPWASAEVLGEAQQMVLYEPPVEDAYRAWLDQAAHPLNVDAILRLINQPWDGALNYQMSMGNIARGYFDTGPLFVTYDSIGTMNPS